ncbi:MAG TPA: hypothetical protein PKZ61_02635 [Thermoflexales bacterium]|nr:hypothetical protein [Thermoflexales bacterium]
MRVLIIYNEPLLPKDHPEADSEHEILYVADAIGTILKAAGFEVDAFGVDHRPDALIARLRADPPDVVFNLFEHSTDHAADEEWVAGILQWLGIPFTGSPSQTIAVARSKHLAKGVLQAAGLPTPPFRVIDRLPVAPNALGWPVILKPAGEDSSIGIDQGSVVVDDAALVSRAAHILEHYGPPVLVEGFIRGRELSVSVIENPDLRALPPVEILFIDPDPSFWPILSYGGKWKPDTREYDVTPPKYGADVAEPLATQIADLAKRAFQVLGCRDYARIDFRVSKDGQPWIIEINPNPDISPEAMLSGNLNSGGIRHSDYVVDLTRRAAARGG